MSSQRLTPEQRVLRARIAAAERWANEPDRKAAMAKTIAAGPARLTYWEKQVDPEGVLDPGERTRRAEHARRAHFMRLSLKSSKARAARARAARS